MVDKSKYWAAVFFVFVLGSVSPLAMSQLMEHWPEVHGVYDFLHETWILTKTLKINFTGLVKSWQFVGSGAGLAGIFCWLFEKWLWKLSSLQGWFVLVPYIQGTWQGVLVPKTRAMQGGPSASNSSWWQERKVLPVHVTIKHKFDRIIYTAEHPNSTNVTWVTDLNGDEESDEMFLCVVYRNTPTDPDKKNAAEHDGCLKVKLIRPENEKSASSSWQFTGKYWTDKRRQDTTSSSPQGNELVDRGTWGTITFQWKSRELLPTPDWTKPEKFV